MRIDVIGTILSVILYNENRRIIPIRAMRDRIRHSPDCQIIVGDGGSRSGPPCSGSASVVVWEIHLNELRQFLAGAARFHKLIKFAKEFVCTKLVGVIDREVGIEWINVVTLRLFGWADTLQPRNCPWPWARTPGRIPQAWRQRIALLEFCCRARTERWRRGTFPRRARFLVPAPDNVQHLPIDAVAEVMFGQVVPKKTSSWIVWIRNALIQAVSEILRSFRSPVNQRPDFFDVV